MKKLSILAVVILVVAAILVVVRVNPALAHERRPVGPYQFVVGWNGEPAYAGVYNRAEIFISMADDSTKMVEGAEQSLKLEVSYGGQTKTLKLEAAYKEPGHYVASIIPSRAGDYSFHITGKLGDTTIDETFSSADGKFGSIEPASDILFPEVQNDAAGLQAQIDALKAEIEQLKAAK
jgi:hypothetical protein